MSGVVTVLFASQLAVAQDDRPDFSTETLENIQKRAAEAAAKDEPITLAELGIAFSALDIPAGPLEKLDHLGMKLPSIVEAPLGFTGFGIKGSVVFTGREVDMTLYIVKDLEGKNVFSVTIGLPSDWKMSDLDPSFAKMDKLSLPSGRMIVSSFEYQDPTTQVYVKKGLNLLAGLELTGPLSVLGDIIREKGKLGEAFIFTGESLVLQGIIPRDIKNSIFIAKLPLEIGVDLTKIKKVPKEVTSVIKTLTVGELTLKITPPPNIQFMISAGITIGLATQLEPLTFVGGSTIKPQSMSLAGSVEGLLELKWFALGNAGIQIDIDPQIITALAAIGAPIPFSGLSMRGELELGKAGKDRLAIGFTGGFALKSDGIPTDFIFEGAVKNVQLSRFIQWVAQKADTNFDVSKVPPLVLEKAQLTLIPGPTAAFVAGKRYNAGILVVGKGQVERVKLAGEFFVDPNTLVMRGSGHLAPIKTKEFVLTGKGADRVEGTEDDGAFFEGFVPVKNPIAMRFAGTGAVEIPKLAAKGNIDFKITPTELDFEFSSMVSDRFTLLIHGIINLKSPSKFKAEFKFEQDFIEYLMEQMKSIIPRVEDRLQKLLTDLNKKLMEAKAGVSAASKKAEVKISDERKSTDKKIKSLEKRIRDLKSECRRKIFSKSCFEIPAREAERAGLLAYRETLKVGAKTSKGVLGATKATLKQLGNLEAQQKALEAALTGAEAILRGIEVGATTVQLKKAHGSTSSDDLSKGKLPRLDELVLELSLPEVGKKTIRLTNLQFDFQKPGESTKEIVQQILSQVFDIEL